MNLIELLKIGSTVSKVSATSHPPLEYGTEVSGFVFTKDGTRCGTCDYEADDVCNHPTVMHDPKVPKNGHGDAVVKDGNCCKYWWPRGVTKQQS